MPACSGVILALAVLAMVGCLDDALAHDSHHVGPVIVPVVLAVDTRKSLRHLVFHVPKGHLQTFPAQWGRGKGRRVESAGLRRKPQPRDQAGRWSRARLRGLQRMSSTNLLQPHPVFSFSKSHTNLQS